jgi:hypothetical protein
MVTIAFTPMLLAPISEAVSLCPSDMVSCQPVDGEELDISGHLSHVSNPNDPIAELILQNSATFSPSGSTSVVCCSVSSEVLRESLLPLINYG